MKVGSIDCRARWVAVAMGCLIAGGLLGGCAVAGPPRGRAVAAASTPAPLVDTSAAATASADTRIVATALQFAWLDPPSFADEPSGDVRPDGPGRVYAHISAVSLNPPSVTFDAEQFYPEGDAAAREAAKDKQPAPEQGGYARNRYRHEQTMRVTSEAGVVGQFGADSDMALGVEDAAQFSAISFGEFAKRFGAPGYAGLKNEGYWIGYDADGAQSILMQYAP
jgi:hypothetical protein